MSRRVRMGWRQKGRPENAKSAYLTTNMPRTFSANHPPKYPVWNKGDIHVYIYIYIARPTKSPGTRPVNHSANGSGVTSCNSSPRNLRGEPSGASSCTGTGDGTPPEPGTEHDQRRKMAGAPFWPTKDAFGANSGMRPLRSSLIFKHLRARTRGGNSKPSQPQKSINTWPKSKKNLKPTIWIRKSTFLTHMGRIEVETIPGPPMPCKSKPEAWGQ